jgi:hypothetical protein
MKKRFYSTSCTIEFECFINSLINENTNLEYFLQNGLQSHEIHY